MAVVLHFSSLKRVAFIAWCRQTQNGRHLMISYSYNHADFMRSCAYQQDKQQRQPGFIPYLEGTWQVTHISGGESLIFQPKVSVISVAGTSPNAVSFSAKQTLFRVSLTQKRKQNSPAMSHNFT